MARLGCPAPPRPPRRGRVYRHFLEPQLLPMISKQQPNVLADFNLLMAAFIWGGNVVAMKFAISVLNPFYFNAFRFVFSMLTLAIWIVITRRRDRPTAEFSMSRGNYISTILLYAFLFGVVYQVAFLIGMYKTSATNTALIMSSVPMWTAIIAIIFLGERLSAVSWAGLATTFIGTMIVALDKPAVQMEGASQAVQAAALTAVTTTSWGNAIMLFCAIAWSVSTVISRPVLKYISPVQLSFWGIGLALPFHILFAFLQPTDDFVMQQQTLLRPSVLTASLYSGIFSTGIALAMWSYGVKILGASHAAIYSNLIPLVALILGWMFLNEIPTPLQLTGGVMIICGLLVMRRG